MSLKLYAFTCGWVTMPLKLVLGQGEGWLRMPIPAYLIDHPKGRVLFDSGLHLDMAADADAYLGGAAKIFRVEFATGEAAGAWLERLEIGAEGVDFLVNSHLHFDHCGGNAQVPDARLVVQAREWEAGRDPDIAAANGYKQHEYDLGHDLMLVDGEFDLFGDGSVVCIPTHGHTPGHQSLKVRLPEGDAVLAADACYLRQTLEEMALPRVAHDPEAMRRSLETLRDLQRKGAVIFYGHDAEFWEGVAQAPKAVSLAALEGR